MEGLLQDFGYSIRSLSKSFRFTVVAVLTLACGIGITTAMFSFVNGIWLRGYPYREPQRLVVLRGANPSQGLTNDGLSLPDAYDFRSQNKVFQDIAIFWTDRVSLVGQGDPVRVKGAGVTANLFPVLGVEPMLGRTFTQEEDQPEAEKVVLLSYRLWQRLFNGDPGVIGKSLRVEGEPATVVGVLPLRAQYPDTDAAEIFYPLARSPDSMPRMGRPFSGLARLKPGATVEQAQAEMSTIANRLEQEYPMSNTGWGVEVTPLQEYRTRGLQPFILLWGAVGFLWLISCTNMANLLLQRAATRSREFALRVAMGAGRRRLVQQVLCESLLLALAGSALGLLLAQWLIKLSVGLIPAELQGNLSFPIDLRVLAFILGIACLTAILFGLLPALQASRPNLVDWLKESATHLAGGVRRSRLRNLLVGVEVALSLLLLVGAILMTQSFRNLLEVDPGFDPANTLVVNLTLPDAQYPMPPQRSGFYDEALQRLNSLPGLVAAAVGSTAPLATGHTTTVKIESQTSEQASANPAVGFQFVVGNYFKAVGIPLLAGRPLNENPPPDAPGEVVVSSKLAKHFWPDKDPLGQKLEVSLMRSKTALTIVGVVGDVRREGLDADVGLDMYLPYRQRPMGDMSLFVRTVLPPMGSVESLRREIHAVDANLPLDNIRTLDSMVEDSVWLKRLASLLFGLFAATALTLAAVGIYGLIAYSVVQRTLEIGIRVALGADRGNIVRMVIRQALTTALTGIAAGLFGAWVLSRILARFLFEVSPTDAVVYVLAAICVLLLVLAASSLPALRAARLNPLQALRQD
jgi:putative ABC transport system permease protein